VAVRFDAASDRISVAGTLPDPSAGFTLMGWTYVEVSTGTNATYARVHAASGASTTATVATDGGPPAGPAYFTAGGSIVSSTQAPVGAWRHVAITCLATDGVLYVAAPGGATDSDTGTVGGAASPTGLTLGGRSPTVPDEFLNGRLAYWRLWSTQLTQVQVEAERVATTPVVTANLWADWPLATADDLTDHSGNGRHMVAGTTPVTTADGPPLGVEVTGTASALLGALVATGAGQRAVIGVGGVNLGALAATATGGRTVRGVGVAGLGTLVGAVTGLRAVVGLGVASLGRLTAHVSLTGTLPTTRLRVSGREPTTSVAGREPGM
jgi:hypothetical protein